MTMLYIFKLYLLQWMTPVFILLSHQLDFRKKKKKLSVFAKPNISIHRIVFWKRFYIYLRYRLEVIIFFTLWRTVPVIIESLCLIYPSLLSLIYIPPKHICSSGLMRNAGFSDLLMAIGYFIYACNLYCIFYIYIKNINLLSYYL